MSALGLLLLSLGRFLQFHWASSQKGLVGSRGLFVTRSARTGFRAITTPLDFNDRDQYVTTKTNSLTQCA